MPDYTSVKEASLSASMRLACRHPAASVSPSGRLVCHEEIAILFWIAWPVDIDVLTRTCSLAKHLTLVCPIRSLHHGASDNGTECRIDEIGCNALKVTFDRAVPRNGLL